MTRIAELLPLPIELMVLLKLPLPLLLLPVCKNVSSSRNDVIATASVIASVIAPFTSMVVLRSFLIAGSVYLVILLFVLFPFIDSMLSLL